MPQAYAPFDRQAMTGLGMVPQCRHERDIPELPRRVPWHAGCEFADWHPLHGVHLAGVRHACFPPSTSQGPAGFQRSLEASN
jgi:hypothetical protein